MASPFEVALHEIVVAHHDALDELLVHRVLGVDQVVGDRAHERSACAARRRRWPCRSSRSAIPAEAGLLADRQLERGDPGPERARSVGQGAVEVGPLAVELVDERPPGAVPARPRARQAASVWASTPSTALTTTTARSATEQAAAHLGEEVGVARGVEDVDLDVVDRGRGEGQRERHVGADLLGLEVAHRRAVVDPSPGRVMAPVAKSSASARVVLPAPLWPTRATLRIRDGDRLGTRTSPWQTGSGPPRRRSQGRAYGAGRPRRGPGEGHEQVRECPTQRRRGEAGTEQDVSVSSARRG